MIPAITGSAARRCATASLWSGSDTSFNSCRARGSGERRVPELLDCFLGIHERLKLEDLAILHGREPADRMVCGPVVVEEPEPTHQQHDICSLLDRLHPEVEFGDAMDLLLEEEPDVVSALVDPGRRNCLKPSL